MPALSTTKTPRRTAAFTSQSRVAFLHYLPQTGMDAYLKQVHDATPMQLIEVERQGIDVAFITDLSKRMDIPEQRFFNYLRIPKATAQRKKTKNAVVDGHAGQAALGMARLAAMAQDMVKESTAPDAQGFDAVRWLGQWIERPQPALDGQRPADLLDTPTGVDLVVRLLGAVQSGAYQ
jgi:putative toxin-antitoxin system antitoxin component (TIGR02293 family)